MGDEYSYCNWPDLDTDPYYANDHYHDDCDYAHNDDTLGATNYGPMPT
jgi:hypothetical protein